MRQALTLSLLLLAACSFGQFYPTGDAPTHSLGLLVNARLDVGVGRVADRGAAVAVGPDAYVELNHTLPGSPRFSIGGGFGISKQVLSYANDAVVTGGIGLWVTGGYALSRSATLDAGAGVLIGDVTNDAMTTEATGVPAVQGRLGIRKVVSFPMLGDLNHPDAHIDIILGFGVTATQSGPAKYGDADGTYSSAALFVEVVFPWSDWADLFD